MIVHNTKSCVQFCFIQAIKCSLTGLEELNTATELVYSIMESTVLGKYCVASVDKRYDLFRVFCCYKFAYQSLSIRPYCINLFHMP